MLDSNDSTPPQAPSRKTITVTLEDQGISRPHRLSVLSAFHFPGRSSTPRCEHEVRSGRFIRQCSYDAIAIVDGRRLCRRHAYKDHS